MLQQLINIYNEQGRPGVMFFLTANLSSNDKKEQRINLYYELSGAKVKNIALYHIEQAFVNYLNTPKLF